ncbi:WD repeat-containing protein 81-like [Asterias amurensis]|uniref:WD repeat-containing protein 81-like n=1 Tax=Asterias amurensis TaxID=7602 RepID=UPI003AB1FB07
MAVPVPSTLETILGELKLESSQVQEVPGSIVAVVHNDWLHYLFKNGVVPTAKQLNVPHACWEKLPGRPAHGRVESPWKRVEIEIISKPTSGKIIVPKINPKWLMKGDLGFMEFMQCLAKQNYLNQWERMYQKHATLLTTNRNAQQIKQDSSMELEESLKALFNCPIFKTCQRDRPQELDKTTTSGLQTTQVNYQQHQEHPNMVPVVCIISSAKSLFIIRNCVEHTLQDCITFSPAMLGNSYAKPLFVIYQILKAFDFCHRQGVPCGEITLRDFSMDKNLWVQFRGPKWNDLIQRNCCEESKITNDISSSEGGSTERLSAMETPANANDPIQTLPELVLSWVKGELSNFDYLMTLNSLAGRHASNPNHYPVLPWVMDFTRPDGGYRDLSKSKYRLTKGDHQLDFMYESSLNQSSSPTDTALQNPHHISDVLSEITYYVYTARRTPKSVLCAHVRSTWVPNEYPSSIQRLQEWTPDECIPEFFTDPKIFQSIHEDLLDLEVPTWSSGPEDFIAKHRAILESDYVSDRLHRWIDLTFGFKLSGGAAIRAKNVCLHLVDQHTHPTSHGAVQLFNVPHPRRLIPSPYLSPSPPTIIRKQPRVDGSVTGRTADIEIVQPEVITVSNEQTMRASEFTTGVVAAKEATPEIIVTSGQSDGTGGSSTATDGSTCSSSSGMEIVSETNLEVSIDTIDTINSIVSSGSNGSKAIDMPSQPPSVQPLMAQTADESSLLKNPIKKLPFFRSKADTLIETKPLIQRPEQMRISLPDDYEPLAALNQLESLYSFSSKALQGLPANRGERTPADCSIHLLGQDMHVMGCLIVEMFLAPKLRMLHQNVPLLERWKILRRVFDTDWLDLPRPVRQVTRLLLEMDTKPNLGDITDHLYRQPAMGLPHPTANMLLQPAAEVIYFPGYMPNVYKLLSDLQTASSGSAGKMDLKKQSVAKIHHVSRHLPKIVRQLTAEGRELLFPYLLELFESVDTALYACLLLLTKVAQFIGPQQATRKLLPCLSQVYDSEFTSPNFMLLFHQSFLAKLIVWFGLRPFLSNIIAFVVDAVTGLKECPEFRPAVDDPISIIADDKKVRPTSMDVGPLDLINLDGEVDLQVTNDVDIALDQGDGESESLSSDEDIPSSSSRKDSESTDTSSLGPTAQTENQEDTHPDDSKSEKPSEESGISQVSNEVSDGQRTSELSSEETKKSRMPTDALLSNNSDGSHEEMVPKSDGAIPADIPTDNSDSTLDLDAIVTDAVKKTAEPDPSVAETDLSIEEPSEDPIQEYLMSSLTKGRLTSLGNLPPGSRLMDVAVDSVTWLSRRLGPALTVTHLTKRLLKALKTCFMGGHLLSYFDLDSDSDSSDDEYGVYIERRTVLGDSNAKAVLGCLTDVAVLYGEEFIFKRYLTYIKETVCSVRRKINLKAEANLVSCIVLLRHLIPFITDSQLMDKLTFIFRKILQPLVNVVQSCQLSFPSGAQGRAVICYKLVDVMTTIGLRIGREMAREHMTGTLQHFFVCFELVHGDRSPGAKPSPDMERRYNQFSHSTDSEDMYCEIKVDSQTNQYKIGTPTKLENLHGEMARSPNAFSSRISDNLHVDVLEDGHNVDPEIMKELRETFSPEMANTAYIPLCRLTGSIHMERILYNHDLIWKLSSQHEKALADQRAAAVSTSAEVGDQGEAVQRQTSWFVDIGALDNTEDLLDPGNVNQNPNAQVIGNRIDIATYSSDSDSDEEDASQNVARSTNVFKSKRQNPSLLMGKSKRQLKGEWLSYWENFCDNAESSSLTYNQIKLQTFVGHTGGIKALYGMDNENSFMSASKDKTVKLWSLRNQGDGSGKSSCRYTYSHHKKGVFSVTFLESQRLVASCDGNVHLWDPFTGAQVHRYDLAKFVPSLLVKMPSPSPVLVVAMADTSVRLIDTRSSIVQQELKVASGTLGLIRCLAVSPGSSTLGVGLSSGVLSMVDLSSGLLLGGWRAHDGEVMQIKACSGNRFLTSSVDHTIALWREDGTKACTFRGASEPVHCMSVCDGQIVSATTSNRIGIHTTLDQQASFSSHRVRSDLVKGMVTTLDVMPLNRLFLVGSDTGLVTLLA